jgi:Leucine-rich repeat (LRR) protein
MLIVNFNWTNPALEKKKEKSAMKTQVNTTVIIKRHPVRQIIIFLVVLGITMIGAGMTAQVVMGDVERVPVTPSEVITEDIQPPEEDAIIAPDTEETSQPEPLISSDNTVSPESVPGMSIRDILSQNVKELALLTYLDAGKMGLTDLSGIEACTSLQTLILWDNEISDISPLSTLPNLKYLFLGGNRIIDLSPLSTLPNLSELYIWNNEVSDLSPLSDMPSLT